MPDTGKESYRALNGLYVLHDELGSGGFGKVKLATHLLTGQYVAIKIIDKKKIGNDLPRVKTEMDALRTLSHQNICQLYQYIETTEKFFIIMEYCSGGEMFDYIVRKERLPEAEARHFFRQLVQAIAYVHSLGYAHRDLKPENLLLTEELKLKLIDFGLCARPGGPGLVNNKPLDTCCGSPAYAAPELILGQQYLGNRADVWSMGVLLYALLCGALPFEDDNMQLLYRKISNGRYYEPDFLTNSSKELLKRMLQVDPERRITVNELLRHPWLNSTYQAALKWQTIYDKNLVDEDVAREMAYHYGTQLGTMVGKIKEWRFDYLTATYHLLLQLKARGEKFALPPPRLANNQTGSNVISSPTIHNSLENNLDRSGLSDDDEEAYKENMHFKPDRHIAAGDERKKQISQSDESGSSFTDEFEQKMRISKALSPDRDKKNSYARAVNEMLHMPSAFTGRSPQQRILFDRQANVSASTPSTPQGTLSDRDSRDREHKFESLYATAQHNHNHRVVTKPQSNLGYESSDKENQQKNAGGTTSNRDRAAGRGPVRITDDVARRYIYQTPQRPAYRGNINTDSSDRRPIARPRSTDRSCSRPIGLTTPPSIKSHNSPIDSPASGANSSDNGSRHTPRSATKTSKFRTRVFTSLERKAGKMINMLTPRKVRNNDSPQIIRSVQNMVNISVTSSDNPDKVRNALVTVFMQQNMKYEASGFVSTFSDNL
ncbi:hypothetical protein WR25_04974 isoform C [Diploscapter pachys]|uniref:non-specific serine/threonine protein kinase n=2 Tax=Diploscapter pachys TaxID=2018661 RepID=A0A2A2KZE1_9BILA|nr:hypothetical protein WR25_04974 isoform C [Diploscapter pachys]